MAFRFALFAAAFALSACAPVAPPPTAPAPAPAAATPTPTQTSSDQPPTDNGVYVYPDCEGEGGCPNRQWRTMEPTALLAAQTTGAPTLATLAPGEWVRVEVVETRLVPLRGVVLAGGSTLEPGEVVYQLEYEGEGVTTYWVRGAPTSLDEAVQVEWEEASPAPAVEATLGLWARVRRESGQTGWVHKPKFECMGKLAGDENCRD